jgi:hypothetical protein
VNETEVWADYTFNRAYDQSQAQSAAVAVAAAIDARWPGSAHGFTEEGVRFRVPSVDGTPPVQRIREVVDETLRARGEYDVLVWADRGRRVTIITEQL